MAAAELSRRSLKFELVLAGDGDMRAEIDALVRSQGIEDRVRITGWLSSSEVRSEILASRAMVLPSFAEGLPVVIMEAMALGRPVLSTYIAGIPELIKPGVTGWLVPAGDVAELADAMETVLATSDDRLAEMGRMGRQLVEARHGANREAGKLAVHIRQAIGLA
jgi:glycosyltransferase involved in cell wall biosynthesis